MASFSSLPPGTVLDRYTIESVLGAGGFGVTYRALDAVSGAYVALKENFPSYLVQRDASGHVAVSGNREEFDWTMKHFIKEARILAKLSHPGIVRVYRAFETRGTAYFAMEYLDAVSLLPSAEQWTVPGLAELMRQLLDALGYVHGAGIYHRDIKPANIMLRRSDSSSVLIDFGAAKLESNVGSLSRGFESRGYSAPEQLADCGKLGPWSDVYSLGATLYCLLTGAPPTNAAGRLFRDDYQPLVSMPHLKDRYPAVLLSGIDRALALTPEARFRSAGQWLKAMEQQEISPSAGRTPNGLKRSGLSSPAPTMKTTPPPDNDQVSWSQMLRWLALGSLGVGGLLMLVMVLSLLGPTTQSHLLDRFSPIVLGLIIAGFLGYILCRIFLPSGEDEEP